MTVLMRDALAPNILQTLEGGPCFVHGGPFANVAHGANSVVADRLALKLCDVVVTECGFGADLGGEKIMDIKCRQSGIKPDAAVVVATIRTLKMNGGVGKVVAGKPLDPALLTPNVEAVRKGCENLKAHVQIMRGFGVPVVVALNSFPEDTAEEVEAVRAAAKEAGALDAVTSRHFAEGGEGAMDLARAVMAACEQPANFAPIYPDDMPLAKKIETIATKIYGADGVDIAKPAADRLAKYEAWGYGKLSICMAKTQYSLSADPSLKGRPRGFRIPVREVRLAAGAGFVTCVTGDLMLMPGLPSKPVGESFEI
jgi:formyltetrahydrofolate synthetase